MSAQPQDADPPSAPTPPLDVMVVENWLVFQCPKCTQTIKIDRKDSVYEVECPSCHAAFEPLLAKSAKGSTGRKTEGKRVRRRPDRRRNSTGGSNKPSAASLPSEGVVELAVTETRQSSEKVVLPEPKQKPPSQPALDSNLPKRSGDELEKRLLAASVENRLHPETEKDQKLDAIIEKESGGQYKRIRVRTRKKRATEEQRARRFYLLSGLGALVIVSLGLYLASTRFLGEDGESGTSNRSTEELLNAPNVDNAPIGARTDNWKTLMNQFSKADSPDAILNCIRKPKRLEERVRAYYAAGVPKLNVRDVTRDNVNDEAIPKTFRRYRMRLEGRVIPVYLEKTETHGYRLDWPSFVGLGTVSWEELKKNRSSAVERMRVRVAEATYFDGPFKNDETYKCFRLQDESRDHTLYGYVKRRDDRTRNFLKLMLNATEAKVEPRLYLEMRYPVGAENDTQVEIVRMLDTSWLRP